MQQKSHFQYDWWAYPVIAAVIVLAWSLIFSVRPKVPENKKVSIDFYGDVLQEERLRADLQEEIERISWQELEKINVAALNHLGNSLFDVLTTRMLTSDMMIFPEDALGDGDTGIDPGFYFQELPKAEFEQQLQKRLGKPNPEIDYYTMDGKIYGVYLPENCRFVNYCSVAGRYVVCFSECSANLCGIYGVGNGEDGAALDILIYLMEETNDAA